MSADLRYSGWDKRYSSNKEGWAPIPHHPTSAPSQELPNPPEFYQFHHHHQSTRKPEFWSETTNDRLELNVDRQTIAGPSILGLGQVLGQVLFFVAAIYVLIFMALPSLPTLQSLPALPAPYYLHALSVHGILQPQPFPLLKAPPYIQTIESYVQPHLQAVQSQLQPLPASPQPPLQNHPRCGITTGGQVWTMIIQQFCIKQ